MNSTNAILMTALAIAFAFALAACPAVPMDDGTTDAGGAGSTSTAPQTQPNGGVAAEGDTAAVGESTTAAGGTTGEGETAEGAGAETGAAEGEGAETSGSETAADGTASGKLNPFPPNGTMWTRDELGKNQNVKTLVLCETDKGNVLIEVYPEIAPNSAKAFLDLVKAGYYDGTYFHRYVRNFVAQAGCALNSVELQALGYDKSGWPDKAQSKVALEKQIGVIKDEPNYANNDSGTLSLAKIGYDKDTYEANSAGAEFFINLKFNQELDKHFTVFGKITSGMDVVAKLTQDDMIRSMRILEGE